jgi:hypothetical protein
MPSDQTCASRPAGSAATSPGSRTAGDPAADRGARRCGSGSPRRRDGALIQQQALAAGHTAVIRVLGISRAGTTVAANGFRCRRLHVYQPHVGFALSSRLHRHELDRV